GGILVFRAREPFERIYLGLYQQTESFDGFALAIYLTVFLLVALATVPMGASFPAVVRLLATSREDDARIVGRAYFVNTMGAVAGALAGELWLLPRLGFDGLIAPVVMLYLGSAELFWALSPPKTRRADAWRLLPIALVAVALTPPIRAF